MVRAVRLLVPRACGGCGVAYTSQRRDVRLCRVCATRAALALEHQRRTASAPRGETDAGALAVHQRRLAALAADLAGYRAALARVWAQVQALQHTQGLRPLRPEEVLQEDALRREQERLCRGFRRLAAVLEAEIHPGWRRRPGAPPVVSPN